MVPKCVLAGVFVCMSTSAFPASAPYAVEHKARGLVVRIASGRDEYASIGSYDIRVYTNDGADFVAGLVHPRDGEVVRTWLTEDESPKALRVWVWTCSAGSGAYGNIESFELVGDKLVKVPIPEPSAELKAGYMGHDSFDVRNGKLYRQFPVYRQGDANVSPTGWNRRLELDIRRQDAVWRPTARSR